MQLTVNSRILNGPSNLILLQYLKFNGCDVPRFCYHEKLEIAGNCRMCLVEIENVSKPVASCTITATENMVIFTHSALVRKARQAVLEFLLLSHPLDCPICDQGGECDLQDQTLIYGPDRGRFFSKKKTTYDFNLGPFIKTIMTRCINCTRCIRFVSLFSQTENSFTSSLGHLGRGNEVYIGQYLSKQFLNLELSGNIIDLCPVGALTSKSYSFVGRSWEELTFETFDINDTFLTPIRVNVRDNTILRILPIVDLTGRFFFNEWITDVVRFNFDGYQSKRLIEPVRVEFFNNLLYVYKISWTKFCRDCCNTTKFNIKNLSVFIGEFLDLYTLITIKKFLQSVGHSNINIIDNNLLLDLPFFDFRQNYLTNLDYFTKCSEISFEKSFFLTLGLDLRLDLPLINIVLRQKLKKAMNQHIFGFGFKSLANYNIISNNIKTFLSFIEGKSFLCNLYLKAKSTFLFYNNTCMTRLDNMSLFILMSNINKKFNQLFYINNSVTILNSLDLSVQEGIYKSKKLCTFNTHDYINFFLQTNSDYKYQLLRDEQSRCLNIYQGTHFDDDRLCLRNFDYILPSLGFFEQKGVFLKSDGNVQIQNSIITSESKVQLETWKFISLFFNFLPNDENIELFKILDQTLTKYIPISFIYEPYIYIYQLEDLTLYRLHFYNTPFVPLITDLIYKTSLVSKNSLMMHCGYESYYNENKTIFIQ